MPSHHLHTANDAEQIYTGKHVELIVAQGGIHRNSTLHYKTGKLPSPHFTLTFTGALTAHCATRRTNQANLYVKLGPHKHCYNKQYESPVYVEVPQFMGSLNTCKICTHYVAQCWEQVPQEFGITLIVMVRLQQVEMFGFPMARHGTFVRCKL